MRTLERLNNSVERLEREQLVFKSKAGVWMAIIGTVAGVVTQIAIKFLT